eukprot:TRINITY_DN2494_c0_g1_i14.p1 TRINITY_DN2494_c0_g1~~TRINITY_DN2494_c0_g1_i14.p1  ORF type:complete len:106 (+),score=29.21 TRINITY_DN2494_c0_g1_i14:356-673(+)
MSFYALLSNRTDDELEKSMKDVVKEILSNALKFLPKERPKVKEIINKMKELEKKIVLNYSQTELNNNEKIANLLMLEGIEEIKVKPSNKEAVSYTHLTLPTNREV